MADERATTLPPHELAALEETKDFLLTSLRDLEREYGVGDVDESDYRTLKDDYTARAAEALRALDEGRRPNQGVVSSSRGRQTWLTVAGVVVAAVLAGALVAQSSGRRSTTDFSSGADVRAASNRVGDCTELDSAGDADGALSCYDAILVEVPQNVDALTGRGWLKVRNFDAGDGLVDLDEAIALAPRATAPLIFRAVARQRNNEPILALADLGAFYSNGPAAAERELADGFAPTVIEAALDACIAGEVSRTIDENTVIGCYATVLEIDPEHPTGNIYFGWLLARAGQLEPALVRLDRGLAADPQLSQGYVFRAAARASGGDIAGARADLARFDSFTDTPADQQVAADAVAAAIDAGDDPLGS